MIPFETKYSSCKQCLLLNIHIYVYEVISSKWSTCMFLSRKNIKNINSFVSRGVYTLVLATCKCQIWLCSILIILSGDIEENPGPKPSSCDKFFICHWNLNSISAHNFIKISLLRAYISTHNFDILCSSETCLDSIISSNGNNLTIPGYDLYRADHPSNGGRRGGGCIYYKIFFCWK